MKIMKNKIDKYKVINIIFIAVIFVVCLWNVGSLQRIRVVDDGFCYWGIAANFAGYDWSGLISESAYYSYGYSIILVPLFLLHRLGLSMTTIYRLAIVLNAFFLSGCYLMALYMIRELCGDIPDMLKQTVSLFVTLYIGNTAQVGLAWTETFLLFMFWCVLVLLYRVIKEPGYLNILGLTAASAWLFAIHMRSIGVVIAVCMVILLYYVNQRKTVDKKYIIYTFAVSVIFVCLALFIKNYVSAEIYLGNDRESVNNIQSNLNRAGNFLSARGMLDLILSVIGKLYYVAAATFVLGIIGALTAFTSLCSGFIKKIKKQTDYKWQAKDWMFCFILLSFLAEIGIEAMFKHTPFFRSMEARLYDETIIYGRYADFVVGPVIILGIWAIYHLKERYYEVAVSVVMSIAGTMIVQFLYDITAFRKGSDKVGFKFAAVPWVYALADGHKTDFAYYVMMVSIGVLIIMCLIMLILKSKWYGPGLMLVLIAAVWSGVGVWEGKSYTESKVSKEKTVDSVIQIVDSIDDEVPIYFIGKSNTEVKILQWLLADRSIHTCAPENISDIDLDNSIILANSGIIEAVGNACESMDFLYDSGYIGVFAGSESPYYETIASKAREMAHSVDPGVKSIDLPSIATDLSYTKMNGSLYYNYRGTGGGYMTKDMGVSLQDGTYEFIIDIRVRDCNVDTPVGYIESGCEGESVQYKRELKAEDFMDSPRQQIRIPIKIKDYVEPVIGIYTYGEASVRIYGISYIKTDGCICLDSDETEEIADFIESSPYKEVYYVDSDGSGLTGFPWWEHGKLNYLSGQLAMFKKNLKDAYYMVEKTDDAVTAAFTGNMEKLYETDTYIVFN